MKCTVNLSFEVKFGGKEDPQKVPTSILAFVPILLYIRSLSNAHSEEVARTNS
jgi:hypothetical protein